ncbi:MAG TPA: porin [Calditrichia bacterium]|nr:porin [Calditrichota bacterium]HQU73356.1 porin [Calditrichia bacterium]HQV33069.1 porin [Calditrichia bacterium]
MKKLIVLSVTIVLMFSSLVSGQTEEKPAGPSIKFGGYTQMTMIKSETNKALVFGFERVRLGARGTLNDRMDYRLLVDFKNTDKDLDNDGDTPGIIKFAYLDLKPNDQLRLRVGKFKTPLGMEWNTPGSQLDIVKRGLAQSLIFHFDAGAMLYADKLGSQKFGFAAGAFNAGPNKANDVGDPAAGQDYTLAARVSLDPDKRVHLEAFGGSALTSVDSQETVVVLGAGARFKVRDKLQLKAEYVNRDDAQNGGSDGTAYYGQAGYRVHPMLEPLLKYENLDVSDNNKDQANFTFGLNIFLNPAKQNESKIQFNYVLSDLDGGDAFQVLVQGAF